MGDQKVPQLYYPLPRDVQKLLGRRSSGVLYRDLEELIAGSLGRNSTRETEPDALHYLHATLGQMVLLAERLIQRSPIAPEMIHLTDTDIVGPVQIVNR